jgi:hypothetical protein
MKCFWGFGLFLLTLPRLTSGQQAIPFHSFLYGGLLEGQKGQSGGAAEFQTISGVSSKSWFLGAGLGLDHYLYRSVPLFLSVNRNLDFLKRGLLARLDGGYNFPWVDSPTDINGEPEKLSGGGYWSARLEYRLWLSPKHAQAILLGAGYAYKDLHGKENYYSLCDFGPGCPPVTQAYLDYRLRRLVFFLGLEF